ncbi:hypothetical protein LTR08_004955 [Meristemomyces frigidus]|nr:hypothetical protein LTR08_004955 [Meristemomyces frigidus]
METISPYPVTPQTKTSHLRHSLVRPAIATPPTRHLHAPDPPHAQPQPQPPSAPASQESCASVSAQSQGSSVARHLQSSSSNVSQLTNYTDPTSTSPSTTSAGGKQQHVYEQCTSASAPTGAQRVRTPETHPHPPRHGDHVLASPVSASADTSAGVASPAAATNGAKRTASGHVKNGAPSQPSTPMALSATTPGARRPRTASISSTGSRAGELAQQLKTRLGYAMAKVQHGWEHKSIAEVEILATQALSPGSRRSVEFAGGEYSGLQQRPVSAGLSNGAARLSMYEMQSQHGAFDSATTSPPSKRRSGTYGAFMPSPRQPHGSGGGNGYALQPPAVIRQTPAGSSRLYQPQQVHSSHHHHRNNTHHTHNNNNTYATPTTTAMSPPRTPISNSHTHTTTTYPPPHHQPPTLRTTTQTAEAERDALQALFQLGSPRAPQLQQRLEPASQAGSAQASPLRAEYATPRRVTFAGPAAGEGSGGEGSESGSGSGRSRGGSRGGSGCG